MGLFENFPYANFHELNLDWILHELKALETEITNFVAINSVKYANPITWDITSQYETNTVVLDSSGNAYLSVQPVPDGVALDREEYWTKIGNFSALWDSVRSAAFPSILRAKALLQSGTVRRILTLNPLRAACPTP